MTARRTLPTALLVLALAGCGAGGSIVEAMGDPLPTPPTASPTPGAPALPDGWRWEAWRGVQLGVPGDWTWINGSQRESQWCVGGPKASKPGIGRPGISTLVGCMAEGGADPSSRIEANGVFATFGEARLYAAGVEGDRLTVHVGEVAILIQAEPALRKRIASTVHEVEVDANGCPQRDTVTDDPALAPRPAVALAKLGGVVAVAACRYGVKEGENDRLDGPSLESSIRIVGTAAAEAITGLADAPAAGGQDEPANCLYKYGSEMLVLLVDSAAGRSRVHVRFSGCDHNAVDDGVSPRALTPAVQPFFSGGNRPNGFSGGPGKAEAVMNVRDGRVPEPTGPPTAAPR